MRLHALRLTNRLVRQLPRRQRVVVRSGDLQQRARVHKAAVGELPLVVEQKLLSMTLPAGQLGVSSRGTVEVVQGRRHCWLDCRGRSTAAGYSVALVGLKRRVLQWGTVATVSGRPGWERLGVWVSLTAAASGWAVERVTVGAGSAAQQRSGVILRAKSLWDWTGMGWRLVPWRRLKLGPQGKLWA